ncbi:PREDICTED: uncharacterized protein LOC109115269 [Nelumbo nucifera]|uniref:Uncharacterized protein LOC109115269 n=1 Tax=Nelumbo nucifera TaxID=4432 RepID=A0A1U8Q9A3_NELNU|nr:PREDICTED: uncharacterized protein LOC109115269 [Nelumbo nucifera]
MEDEYKALLHNDTWDLVPPPPHKNIVGNRWAYKIKRRPDGSIERYKAQLVAQWFTQQARIDFAKTFSPVVKPTTIRLIISLAVHYGWNLRQLGLSTTFALRDLGEAHYFLGLELHRSSDGVHLSQRKYIHYLLVKTKMHEAKPIHTPMAASTKLDVTHGSPLPDATEYRNVVGALQYIIVTRLDVSFSVNKVCQFMKEPTNVHWSAVKRILRYLKSIIDHVITFRTSLELALEAFSDANWTSCPVDHRSQGSFCVYLGRNLISWSSHEQSTVSRSSTELEYRSLASTAAEILWLQMLLTKLGLKLPRPPVIWCDNLSAKFLSSNPVHHSHTKHIELDVHFIREKVAAGLLLINHIPSHDQIADILTKHLPSTRFNDLTAKLIVSKRPLSLRGDVRVSQ